MLTRMVLHGDPAMRAQLKGIMVGNGVFWCGTDDDALQFNLFYWHGLVSYTNFVNWTNHGCDRDSTFPGCKWIMNATVSQIGVIFQQLYPERPARWNNPQQPSLDPDNLYQDFCLGNGTLKFTENDPFECKQPLGNRTSNYLNRPDVQKAIHARPTFWEPCSNGINYTISFASLLPYYQEFFALANPLHVLIYGGDIDIATVPFTHNQACLHKLRRKNVKLWAPWFVNGATAGYVEYFDKYVFATVKGGGHEMPLYQPLSGYNMFARFLQNQNLDPTKEELLAMQKKRPSTPIGRQGQVLRRMRQGAY